jgi:protein-disulfide isomerase
MGTYRFFASVCIWLAVMSLLSCAGKAGSRGGGDSGGKGVKAAALPALSKHESITARFFLDPSDPGTDAVLGNAVNPLTQAFGDRLKWEVYAVAWSRVEPERKASGLIAAGIACAQKQGKGMEFLMEARKSAGSFSARTASAVAGRISLKADEFAECWKTSDPEKTALENADRAAALSLRSVPALMIEDALLFGNEVKPEVYKRVAEGYLNPPPTNTVTLFVFYDPGCRVCNEQMTHLLITTYENVVPIRIPADRPENKQLALSLGLDRLPAYVFRGPVKTLSGYRKIEKLLRPLSGSDLYEVEVSFYAGIRKFIVPLPRIREDHILGDPKAPVTVYDFSDFQCPACARLALDTFPEVKRALIDEGKARWAYVHFPLTQAHEVAFPAAVASECAGRQGKFWQYHDLLFQYQKGLNREMLFTLAARLPGVSSEKFTACMSDRKIQDLVAEDAAIAEKLRFPGTPTLVVGPYVTGSLPFEELYFLIETVASEQSGDARSD